MIVDWQGHGHRVSEGVIPVKSGGRALNLLSVNSSKDGNVLPGFLDDLHPPERAERRKIARHGKIEEREMESETPKRETPWNYAMVYETTVGTPHINPCVRLTPKSFALAGMVDWPETRRWTLRQMLLRGAQRRVVLHPRPGDPEEIERENFELH